MITRQVRSNNPGLTLIALSRTPVPADLPYLVLLCADQGQIDKPRLRRNKTLHLRAHRARIEIMDNIKPGRIVDEAFMCLAVGGRDDFRVGRLWNTLRRLFD